MARQVRWTEIAWRDLQQVADYIARDSRHYAAGFVRRVRNAARSLNLFPKRGRMVPEFGHEDVREIFVGRYRLIYHVADSRYVDVLAFIHGARDLLSTWERESRPDPTA